MMSRKEIGWGHWLLASAWMLPALGLSLAVAAWPGPSPPWMPGLCWVLAGWGLHAWGTDAARLAWDEADEQAGARRMEEFPEKVERQLSGRDGRP